MYVYMYIYTIHMMLSIYNTHPFLFCSFLLLSSLFFLFAASPLVVSFSLFSHVLFCSLLLSAVLSCDLLLSALIFISLLVTCVSFCSAVFILLPSSLLFFLRFRSGSGPVQLWLNSGSGPVQVCFRSGSAHVYIYIRYT